METTQYYFAPATFTTDRMAEKRLATYLYESSNLF